MPLFTRINEITIVLFLLQPVAQRLEHVSNEFLIPTTAEFQWNCHSLVMVLLHFSSDPEHCSLVLAIVCFWFN